MLVHEKMNNIGETIFKNSYHRPKDPSFLSRIVEILHQVVNASYIRRISAVIILVFAAFLLNSVVGRVLENFRRTLMHRMLLIPGANAEGGDDVVFGLDLAFGLVNLTCTAFLAWEVHDIATWILQSEYETSQND